jgi:hypothetical protein
MEITIGLGGMGLSRIDAQRRSPPKPLTIVGKVKK